MYYTGARKDYYLIGCFIKCTELRTQKLCYLTSGDQ